MGRHISLHDSGIQLLEDQPANGYVRSQRPDTILFLKRPRSCASPVLHTAAPLVSLNNESSELCNGKQVFPGGWTAVLVSLDNVGIWNLRAEKLDNWYRGHEVYVKVPDPLGYNITEMVTPDNVLYCGLLKDRQKYVSAECLFSDAVMIHFAVLDSHPALKNLAGHRFMSQTASHRRKLKLDAATGSLQL
jgi:hypothetical protein